MKKKTTTFTETDLLVDLTFHSVPASLLTEFAEKIVKSYYNGNLNAAVQDLIHKALAEQDCVLSHITHLRNHVEADTEKSINKMNSFEPLTRVHFDRFRSFSIMRNRELG